VLPLRLTSNEDVHFPIAAQHHMASATSKFLRAASFFDQVSVLTRAHGGGNWFSSPLCHNVRSQHFPKYIVKREMTHATHYSLDVLSLYRSGFPQLLESFFQ